ncbi:hypothetical protein [Mycobacterium malmoense]|uniref:hypothetical protein n=1 Tax=Mycobacterium malmoense TaxID=1780 RepID=UPI0008F91DFF|nr:hypothetical protein [Mycobacterium malmoense]OIN79995.1 hypothetical protein BMG05_15060 [Mycobacterium malmoense]
MTTQAAAGLYRLIEKPSRVYAIDANDVEICGARQPYGHTEWVVYPTVRLTPHLHQVIALTRAAAVEHVRMLADWYVRGMAS